MIFIIPTLQLYHACTEGGGTDVQSKAETYLLHPLKLHR